MDFSNREIATWIWLFGFIALSMRKDEVRDSALNLIRAFFQWKISLVFALSYLYISACVFILSRLELWTIENIKTTVIWAICYTFRSLLKVDTALNDKYFSTSVRDIFAISGLITFVVELHSFSLTIEMIAVPFIVFLSLLQLVAGARHKGESVEKFINTILTIAVVCYVIYSAYLTYIYIDKLATIATLKESFIPIILALTFLPYLYCIAVVFAYESVFARLSLAIKSKPLRKKTILRALLEFKLNVKSLNRWSQSVLRFHPQDEKQLDEIFFEERMITLRESKPPIISREQGWSPFAARKFLSNEGVIVRDYVRTFQDEWSACSNYLDTDDDLLSNKISLYICGNELAVTEIKFMLDVSNPKLSDCAESKFYALASMLLARAIVDIELTSIITRIKKRKDFTLVTSFEIVSLKRIKWTSGIRGGYSRTLTIKSKCHKSTA